jgi:hypothetical protein
MKTVKAVWEEIRQEGRPETGWHVRRIHVSAPCEILAGIHQPDAAPGLLIEVPPSAAPPGLFPHRSRGFAIESGLVPNASPSKLRVSLTLADHAYEQVFSVLCEDTAREASTASSPREALRLWLNRVHVWQDFMERHGLEGLSEQAACGLFGEILVMRDVIAPVTGPASAVRAWSGPQGEPNDFILPAGFLEVKTTVRQAPDVILISHVDQLDDTRGPVILAHVRLLPSSPGETLPQLISSFRSLMTARGEGQMQSFNSSLMDVGYIDAQSYLYDREYRLQDIDFYRVDGDFPRVRRGELRSGIRTLTYAVDISACAGNRITRDQIEQALHAQQDF